MHRAFVQSKRSWRGMIPANPWMTLTNKMIMGKAIAIKNLRSGSLSSTTFGIFKTHAAGNPSSKSATLLPEYSAVSLPQFNIIHRWIANQIEFGMQSHVISSTPCASHLIEWCVNSPKSKSNYFQTKLRSNEQRQTTTLQNWSRPFDDILHKTQLDMQVVYFCKVVDTHSNCLLYFIFIRKNIPNFSMYDPKMFQV